MHKLMISSLLVLGLASTQIFAADWQALPKQAPSPKDNPTTAAKVELGKHLFLDPRFSMTGTVSCNSCHNIMAGGDDGRQVGMGVHGKTGGRSSPTVWNSAFNSVQFWDGRAPSLEEQAKGPVVADVEMGMANLESAMNRVRAIPGYRPMYEKAFPGEKDPVTISNSAKAVAAFERTLITPNSAYDKYVTGNKKALTAQQVRGMNTFDELGCTSCHAGAAFNGPSMAEGQGFFMKFPTFPDTTYEARYKFTADIGRYNVTREESDKHLFKVPTLRNITLTAPYFHNGSVRNLDEAVRVMGKLQLNKDLSEKQVGDIVAFLGSLTGEFPVITLPRLPATPGTTIVE